MIVRAFIALAFIFVTTCFVTPSSYADSGKLYSWTDEKGKVHFSNTPRNSDAQPAALPAIGRENIDQKIRTLKDSTPENCVRHGGIDCARGADSDGSVICLDGYREAVMPFQFECLEARLQGQFDVMLGAESIPKSRNFARRLDGRAPTGLRLSLRNLTGVAAFGIEVEFKFGHRNLHRAKGPERIEPYGSADYVLSFAEIGMLPNLLQIEQSEYKVTCTNCGAVMQSRGIE